MASFLNSKQGYFLSIFALWGNHLHAWEAMPTNLVWNTCLTIRTLGRPRLPT